MASPPLLRRMNQTRVGDIVVYNRVIYEPLTDCVVARGFPTHEAAVAAAHAMNEVADWPGIIKSLARKERPNCQAELKRIAAEHGGELSGNATASGALPIIQTVAARLDR